MSAAEVATAVAELLLGADEHEVRLVGTIGFLFLAILVTVGAFAAMAWASNRGR